MKALVKAERAEGLVLRDEPKPEIGPDDILIKVAKTGICGTDLHIWKWDEWAQKTIPVPMVVGHEFAGVVADIGSHVRTVKVGDRVSGEGHLIGMKSRMARALYDEGIYVTGFFFPVVPQGKARIRTQMSAAHTVADVEAAAAAFAKVGRKLGVIA